MRAVNTKEKEPPRDIHVALQDNGRQPGGEGGGRGGKGVVQLV